MNAPQKRPTEPRPNIGTMDQPPQQESPMPPSHEFVDLSARRTGNTHL